MNRTLSSGGGRGVGVILASGLAACEPGGAAGPSELSIMILAPAPWIGLCASERSRADDDVYITDSSGGGRYGGVASDGSKLSCRGFDYSEA